MNFSQQDKLNTTSKLSNQPLNLFINLAFSILFFIQSYIGKAAKVSVYLEQRLIKEVETIIEEEGKKSHHEIAAKIEELIENEKEQKIIADVN